MSSPIRRLVLYAAAGTTVFATAMWLAGPGSSPARSAGPTSADFELILGDSRDALCDKSRTAGAANGRSVVFVAGPTPSTIEELGRQATIQVHRIAPAGASAARALTGLFGGTLPSGIDPGMFVLPPHVEGLPAALREHGYATYAVAPFDLTFGNRRAVLRDLGFETFVEPRGNKEFDVVAAVTERLTTHRAASPDSPFFAFVHAPKPEALWAWYREHESARGTILVLTALRADPDAGDWTTPLILEGEGLEIPDEKRGRLGAHADVSATLRELLGLPQGRCDQGLSLLRDDWPDERMVATFGTAPGELRVARGDDAWMLPSDDAPGDVVEFAEALQRVMTWASHNDALASSERKFDTRSPLKGLTPFLLMSHRGNVDGPRTDGASNRAADFDAAVAAGFEWLEFDVSITRDDQLVVMHNAYAVMPRGKVSLKDLTLADLRRSNGGEDLLLLDEFVDAYAPQASLLFDLKMSAEPALNKRLAELIAARPDLANPNRYYQSFSHEIAAYVANACEPCEVGWLTPTGVVADRRAIDAALLHDLDFLSIRHDLVDANFVDAARAAGVRVFVYGVQSPDELTKLGSALPDAVITDSQGLLERPDENSGH